MVSEASVGSRFPRLTAAAQHGVGHLEADLGKIESRAHDVLGRRRTRAPTTTCLSG